MGAMGTDVAIETADIALMGEDLRHLPQVLTHARHARAVMLQNIGLSLAIIGVLIPLAATGVLGLATVVFVHEFAEVLVIANAIRAARTTPLPGQPEIPRTTGQLNVSIAPPRHDLGDACCTPAPAPLTLNKREGTPPTMLTLTTPHPTKADGESDGGCSCCETADPEPIETHQRGT